MTAVMVASQFQLITGETAAGKFLRKMLPVSYLLQGVCLLCILLPTARFLLPVVGVPLLMLFVCAVAADIGKINCFQTSGIIRLSGDGIMLNNELMPIGSLQQVQVKFSNPRGMGAGRSGIGSKGNNIIIYSKVGKVKIVTVLIEDRIQRYTLAGVLKTWRKVGIKVSADGLDLA